MQAQAKEDPLRRLVRGCHLLSALSGEVLEKGYLRASGARDLSFVQLNLLKFLDSKQPRGIGDVMRFMGASFPAASKAVGRLRAKGLVRTRTHPGDRRAQVAGLTPKGRAAVRRYERTKIARLQHLFSDAPGFEIERWATALETLIGHLLREKILAPELCLQCGAYYSDACLVQDRRCRVRLGV